MSTVVIAALLVIGAASDDDEAALEQLVRLFFFFFRRLVVVVALEAAEVADASAADETSADEDPTAEVELAAETELGEVSADASMVASVAFLRRLRFFFFRCEVPPTDVAALALSSLASPEVAVATSSADPGVDVADDRRRFFFFFFLRIVFPPVASDTSVGVAAVEASVSAETPEASVAAETADMSEGGFFRRFRRRRCLPSRLTPAGSDLETAPPWVSVPLRPDCGMGSAKAGRGVSSEGRTWASPNSSSEN